VLSLIDSRFANHKFQVSPFFSICTSFAKRVIWFPVSTVINLCAVDTKKTVTSAPGHPQLLGVRLLWHPEPVFRFQCMPLCHTLILCLIYFLNT
jgi:hypothetical protein